MGKRAAAFVAAMILLATGGWASSTLQVNAGTPYIYNGTCVGAFSACQAQGEVHAITDNSVLITQNSGGAGPLTDPVLVILGMAGTGNVAPTLITGNTFGGYTVTSGGLATGTIWGDNLSAQTTTNPAGVLLSSDAGPNDAYSQAGPNPPGTGLTGLGALGELGVNWSAAYSAVIGGSVSQFQLFVYTVNLNPDLNAKGTFQVNFSNLPVGTFVIAYGCQGQIDPKATCSDTNTNPNPFGTPFTEAGLAVPEPASLSLLCVSLVALGGMRRRFKR